MNIKDFRCNYDKNTLVVPRALVGAACQALGIVVAAGTLLSFDPNLYTIGIVLTGIILMAVGAYILLDEICGVQESKSPDRNAPDGTRVEGS